MSNESNTTIEATGMKREFQTGETLRAHALKYGYMETGETELLWNSLAEIYNDAVRNNDSQALKFLDCRYGFYSAHLERQIAHGQMKYLELRSELLKKIMELNDVQESNRYLEEEIDSLEQEVGELESLQGEVEQLREENSNLQEANDILQEYE